jgi:excisionase family DNA binding protein
LKARIDEPEVWTVAQVAAKLGINRNTVYEAIHRGQIPSIRAGEKLILIPKAAFAAYMTGKAAA